MFFILIDYASRPEEKKRLQLKNIGRGGKGNFSGTYTVQLKGSYCSFSAKIEVIVHVAPGITMTKPRPGQTTVIFKEKEDARLLADIKSGYPKVNVSFSIVTRD